MKKQVKGKTRHIHNFYLSTFDVKKHANEATYQSTKKEAKKSRKTAKSRAHKRLYKDQRVSWRRKSCSSWLELGKENLQELEKGIQCSWI